ncbi:Gfo/Idh/MocA family oxidoreductase [Planctomycetota bacterium]
MGVLGVGHLGQHHARVYSELPGVQLVAVVDRDLERAREVAGRHGVEALADVSALKGRVDAVSVVTPTESHLEVARPLLRQGVHCLVEKPLCTTVDEARSLCRAARESGRKLQVGHIERFNPAIRAIKPMVSDPRFISCDRVSPFSFRSADIGVVLDLMIHDLDIVLHLCDEPVEHVEAMGVPVLVPAEDVAHARLRFRSGATALLTASRVSIKTERKIRIFQYDSYISLDYGARSARIFRKRPGFEFGRADLEAVDTTLPAETLFALVFSQYLEMEEVGMEGEPLKLELESFVNAVREDLEPEVTGESGLRAIEVAGRIQETMAAYLEREREHLKRVSP